jgi:MYXO-CTERM domain-containing protein
MSILRLFSSSFLPATALVALLSYATPSRADVLPPDGCTGSAGPSCNNAGPNNDEPGVCVETTCPHRGATAPDADDFDAETEEPCVLCQIPDGGSSTGDASSKSSSGGCSVSPGSAAGGGLGLMLAAGLALGAVRRRRRAV